MRRWEEYGIKSQSKAPVRSGCSIGGCFLQELRARGCAFGSFFMWLRRPSVGSSTNHPGRGQKRDRRKFWSHLSTAAPGTFTFFPCTTARLLRNMCNGTSHQSRAQVSTLSKDIERLQKDKDASASSRPGKESSSVQLPAVRMNHIHTCGIVHRCTCRADLHHIMYTRQCFETGFVRCMPM